jgi:hypothetical protein
MLVLMSYFLFALTTLCCLGLALLTASQPSTSGDNAMGYGLGLAFVGLAVTLSSLALTIVMLVNGYFHWVAPDGGARAAVVLVGWFAVVLTTFFCAVFKWEWPADANPYPEFLHWLAVRHGQIWIPFLWLIACFLSLRAGAQSSESPPLLKLSFYASLLISSVYSLGLATGYLRDSARAYEAEVASRNEQADRWHRETLNDIAAHKPTDPLTQLLTQTAQVRPADTRAAALAKVKEHPNWEGDILALLQDRQTYREVYYFLDGNAVAHPEQFAEPLNRSILWLAETITADIQDSNNLQHWSFDSYQIENLLRAIDGQFLNQGVDFRPNIVKLQQALNTTPPERFKNVRFDITGVVDQWVASHKPKR